jgi:hypothetical protein
MANFEQEYASDHSPEEVWQALNTPLTRELGRLVNPYVIAEYEELGMEDDIQTGTRIIYLPDNMLISAVPRAFRDLVPKDITFRVEDYDPDNMTRLDVLESRKASGEILRKVEEMGDGTGQLVVEAHISVPGGMFEDTLLQYGVDDPTQRLLEYLPRIIN